MRPSARWLVPVTATMAILATSAISSAAARSAPAPTPRSPAQVLEGIAGCRVNAFSGTVTTHADLGLPALPSSSGSASTGDTGGSGANDPGGPGPGATSGRGNSPDGPPAGPTDVLRQLLTRFLTGDTKMRVWVDGPDRQRVQLLEQLAETDLVRNGPELWIYSSRESLFAHGTLPETTGHRSSAGQSTGPQTMTPQGLADRVLRLADPTTAITLGTPATVAGRDGHTLLITPRNTATLVDRVAIVADVATGLPLRVEVFARHHDEPVLSSTFTTLDLGRPPASRFTITPPPGARVQQLPLSVLPVLLPLPATVPSAPTPSGTASSGTASSGTASSGTDSSGTDSTRTGPAATGPRVRTRGSGWATVIELAPGTAGATPRSDSAGATHLLEAVTTPVEGGRALRTALFSVLLTDDGRVLVGAVPTSDLVAAAG